jgi:hypothetical protein
MVNKLLDLANRHASNLVSPNVNQINVKYSKVKKLNTPCEIVWASIDCEERFGTMAKEGWIYYDTKLREKYTIKNLLKKLVK